MTTTNALAERITLQFLRKPFGPSEVLYFYDGPMLMWLETAQERYLAMALPDDAGKWPFLLVALDEAAQTAVQAGEITLRQAYAGSWPVFLMPDYGDLDDSPVSVIPLKRVQESWLPGDLAI